MSVLQPQFRIHPWTFLMDGRVVETFHAGSSHSERFHVDHLRIDGQPKDDGLQIRWGVEVSGTIVNGGKVTIPSHQVAEFQAFIAPALANRTPPGPGTAPEPR